MTDAECVEFLQAALPLLGLRLLTRKWLSWRTGQKHSMRTDSR